MRVSDMDKEINAAKNIAVEFNTMKNSSRQFGKRNILFRNTLPGYSMHQ